MRALFGGLIGALAYVTYVTVPNIMTYLVVVRAVELLKKIVRAFELLKNRAEPGRAFQNKRLDPALLASILVCRTHVHMYEI